MPSNLVIPAGPSPSIDPWKRGQGDPYRTLVGQSGVSWLPTSTKERQFFISWIGWIDSPRTGCGALEITWPTNLHVSCGRWLGALEPRSPKSNVGRCVTLHPSLGGMSGNGCGSNNPRETTMRNAEHRKNQHYQFPPRPE